MNRGNHYHEEELTEEERERIDNLKGENIK